MKKSGHLHGCALAKSARYQMRAQPSKAIPTTIIHLQREGHESTRPEYFQVTRNKLSQSVWLKYQCLRTVPTFVTAQKFCASRDTLVSYGWCLLIQEYFCAV